jgi:PTH1 family peptidyl-tRNA hydrolase
MKVIVGLGNPGEKYANNRHNVGFMVLDKLLAVRWESKFEAMVCKVGNTLLVKPQTFMNRSGDSVSEIVNFYKVSIDDLIVVHDDLDIRLGEYKIQKGVGPKVHNGLTSVEERLGKADFWRVRVGIDSRQPAADSRQSGEDYVLADFTSEENAVLDKIIKIIVDQLMVQFKI